MSGSDALVTVDMPGVDPSTEWVAWGVYSAFPVIKPTEWWWVTRGTQRMLVHQSRLNRKSL